MRFVARDDGLEPTYLRDESTRARIEHLGEFLESGGVSAKQAYVEVDATEILQVGAEELLRSCIAQFSSKCAFTEMALDGDADVDLDWSNLHLFRPAQGARAERSVEPSERHYWWLVDRWDNYYLAEPAINSLKGQVFPVFGERQAGPDAQADRPVLLDPCTDRPEWYLRFDTDGSVRPVAFPTEHGDLRDEIARRADASIRLYGLDRDELVESRRQAIANYLTTSDANDLDESWPHLGAIRQVLASRVVTGEAPATTQNVDELTPELAVLAWTEPGVADRLVELLGPGANPIIDAGVDVFPELTHARPPVSDASYEELRPIGPVSFDGEPAAPAAIAPNQLVPHIVRIEIRDFKAIEHVDVKLADTADRMLSEPNRFQRLYDDYRANACDSGVPEANRTVGEYAKPVRPTWVFIGENGSGKSSIMQAIALALASGAERALLSEDGPLTDYIRWDAGPNGPRPNPQRAATIRVELLSGTFTLTIRPDGQVIHEAVDHSGNPIDTSGAAPWFLLRAYSATRTLRGDDASTEALSVRNLFDPRVPLVDPEEWLLTLDDHQFGLVAATLHQLFVESNADGSTPVVDQRIARLPAESPNKIVVGDVELRQLSDGYRAVITLFCDVMAAAQALNPTNMREVEGILLIDEIGAHLHPRWRARISSLIRREFARMQVVVSTHEPLCLRGFLGGEAVLVERSDAHGVQLTPIERDPTGLRVDQLLTSEFFGLYTTLDPEENDRLNLYYQLRARKAADPDGFADWEAELLERVRPVETEQVFGYSYREQLTYEAIDRYLSWRQQNIGSGELQARRNKAFNEVGEIWRAFERSLEPRSDEPS